MILCASLIVLLCASVGASCPRDPGGQASYRSSGDGGFKITISGNPEKYVPQSVYTVSIKGSRLFSRFILTADTFPNDGSEASPQRVGSFQLFGDNTVTEFKADCVNTVSEISNDLKQQVQAMWTAPAQGNGCIVLRAMVYISDYQWYADDGQLSLTLCQLTEASTKPEPGQCCACDQAKYKVIFEGLWSSTTHPKDFPFSLWLTHFSDVIGGSHGRNFSFWGEGQTASDALRQVAEWGSVGALEQELRIKGRYLRTLIKAAGLWYPRVNSNTSSNFRVDRSKHLVSLVSMFGPSPDWIVGVSGLDLCLSNCSWIEGKTVDLYPYDAGTDNGITYMSPNSPTMPQDPIKRITSMYPEDPRAPFYDPTGIEMKPLARLYFTREKVFPKSCSDKTEDELLEEVIEVAENSEDSVRKECEVSQYSAWSECSVSCGKGIRSRERSYTDTAIASRANCDRQLISKEMCAAPVPTCPGDEEEIDTITAFNDTICAVSEWGDWSECSSTCGEGAKVRTRHFLHRMGRKKCSHVTYRETIKCMEPPCSQPQEAVDPQCPVTEWSDWSPCSVSCGPGLRIRTRQLLVEQNKKEFCSSRLQLVQQHPCTGKKDCTIDMATAKEICMKPAEPGPCRGFFQRWTFNTMKAMCVPFTYGGCRGNKNNFITEEDCIQACSVVRDNLLQGVRANATSVGVKPITGDPVDCVVSHWSAWSQCSATCGEGYKEKKRTITVEPKNGGHPCPRTMTRRRRCHGLQCNQ